MVQSADLSQVRVGLVELAQERVLRELEAREGHAELLADDVVEVPFACEEAADHRLDLLGRSVLEVTEIPQVQVLGSTERDVVLEAHLLHDIVIHRFPVRLQPRSIVWLVLLELCLTGDLHVLG